MSVAYAAPDAALLVTDTASFRYWPETDRLEVDASARRIVGGPGVWCAATGEIEAVCKAGAHAVERLDAPGARAVGDALAFAFLDHAEAIRDEIDHHARREGTRPRPHASFNCIGVEDGRTWAARLTPLGYPLGALYRGGAGRNHVAWVRPYALEGAVADALWRQMDQLQTVGPGVLPRLLAEVARYFEEAAAATRWMNDELLVAGYRREAGELEPFGILRAPLAAFRAMEVSLDPVEV